MQVKVLIFLVHLFDKRNLTILKHVESNFGFKFPEIQEKPYNL